MAKQRLLLAVALGVLTLGSCADMSSTQQRTVTGGLGGRRRRRARRDRRQRGARCHCRRRGRLDRRLSLRPAQEGRAGRLRKGRPGRPGGKRHQPKQLEAAAGETGVAAILLASTRAIGLGPDRSRWARLAGSGLCIERRRRAYALEAVPKARGNRGSRSHRRPRRARSPGTSWPCRSMRPALATFRRKIDCRRTDASAEYGGKLQF
jgi:hypothetical protein